MERWGSLLTCSHGFPSVCLPRPYFELKAKYYLQLEVRVAFGLEAVGRRCLPSESPLSAGPSHGPTAAGRETRSDRGCCWRGALQPTEPLHRLWPGARSVVLRTAPGSFAGADGFPGHPRPKELALCKAQPPLCTRPLAGASERCAAGGPRLGLRRPDPHLCLWLGSGGPGRFWA